jgi:hypothetical protein
VSAAALPLVARAQQGDRVRRIGVLLAATADNAVFQARIAAFLRLNPDIQPREGHLISNGLFGASPILW